jgi:hypothetical protein
MGAMAPLFGKSVFSSNRKFTNVFTLGAAAATGLFIDFHPSQCSNWTTDYSNAFGEYRVTHAQVRWIPAYADFSFSNNAAIQIQPMYVWGDPIDNGTPSVISDALQRDNVAVMNALRPWTKTVRPSLLQDTSVGNDIVPASRVWLTIGSAPVMYGLKIFMDNCGNANATVMGQFLVTVYYQLRESR